MLFVLITLWALAAVLLFIDRKNASTRWLGAVAFCGGSGAFSVTIDERLIPYAIDRQAGEFLQDLLFYMQAGGSWVSYYGLPYAFILFALHYNRPSFFQRYSRSLPWLLAIPPLLSLWFTPDFNEEQHILYHVIIVWTLPYFAAGIGLVLLRKEWNRTARLIHWVTCLAVLTPVLFSAVMNYVLPSLGLYKMWRYNTWFIAFGFIIFLVAIFNFGFMGIRVRIQKRQLDSAFRVITSGTAILNHAIKNDVGKMKLFSEKIKAHAIETNDQELEADVGVILSAAEHIEQMIRRVHDQTKDLKLQPEEFQVVEAVEQLVRGLEPRLVQGRVKLVRDYEYQGGLHGDRVQITEAIGNVLNNAIEAMPEGGLLTVRIKPIKNYLELQIADTGYGIASKDLPSVLEPFYTTKGNRNHNFGLGLAYSYHVAKKHKGHLDIVSSEGKGTTVSFRFPLAKGGR